MYVKKKYIKNTFYLVKDFKNKKRNLPTCFSEKALVATSFQLLRYLHQKVSKNIYYAFYLIFFQNIYW